MMLSAAALSASAQVNVRMQTACNPQDVKTYDTQRLRSSFLMEKVMVADQINLKFIKTAVILIKTGGFTRDRNRRTVFFNKASFGRRRQRTSAGRGQQQTYQKLFHTNAPAIHKQNYK